MIAVILAGGLGTRISEETHLRPKPMIEIGGKPIIWHIMKLYSAHGINDFIVCCGYKGYFIKEYFSNYFLHTSDVTINMQTNDMHVHQKNAEPWNVTLVDTGELTGTAGRLRKIASFIDGQDDVCFTYGDGLSDVDIGKSVKFHKQHGKLATVTAVQPPGRFGVLDLTGDQVSGFLEKPLGDGARINGGFFVISSNCCNHINDDNCSWESDMLPKFSRAGELMAFQHNGFWQPMDTLRERIHLEELWDSGKAPWKLWT